MKILRYPSTALREPCTPVTAFDDDLRQLIADMTKTMHDENGAGLAAIQVGVPIQLFIVAQDVAVGPAEVVHDGVVVFANPEIVELSDEQQIADEGCLSFPTIFVPVQRARRCCVRAQTVAGVSFEVGEIGFFARALQHEMDHLEGKLLIDHVGPVKADMIKRKLRNLPR